MKTTFVHFFKFSAIAILLSIFLSQCAPAQKSVALKSGDVNKMVDLHQFVFVADRVTPLRGGTRYLTTTYDVKVQKDTLISDLPFFGRAYQAPINPSEGGIHFTSTNFSYDVTANKNNGWNVIIKPKDQSNVQQLSFNIFENGTADLNVTNTNRDPISFYGHIQKTKNKE